MRSRLPALAFPLLLVACSNGPSWGGTVQTRDGVEVVSNPGDPLVRGTQGLVSSLWKLQDPDWVEPSRVHAQSELVTVVDPKASHVHLISTSGEIRASLGQAGGGPGEFLHLLDAFPSDGGFVVIDGGKGNVEYLDPDGRYLSSMHLEGQAWSGFTLADGTLMVKGEFLSDPRQESFGDWVTLGEEGKPRAFVLRPLEPLPEEQGVRCSDVFPWGEGVARLRFTTPRIEMFDRTGGLLKESDVDLPVEVISDSDRESALADLQRRLAASGYPPEFIQQDLVVMKERWRVKCRFGPLRFDASCGYGAFLEQNPDEFGSGPATLHFLSGDGVYLARATFPTAWRDFAMDHGVVYALTRDPDTDLITLEAFRVDLPATVFEDAARVVDQARRRGAGAS